MRKPLLIAIMFFIFISASLLTMAQNEFYPFESYNLAIHDNFILTASFLDKFGYKSLIELENKGGTFLITDPKTKKSINPNQFIDIILNSDKFVNIENVINMNELSNKSLEDGAVNIPSAKLIINS